jgi:ferredoxin
MGTNWGFFLCNCRQTIPLDSEQLVLPTAPSVLFTANYPETDMREFAARVQREQLDRVLIGCCAGAAAFEAAFGAYGQPSPKIHLLDLRNSCFTPHVDAAQAHAKASRLLRAATQTADENFQPAYSRLPAGNRIVIACDGPQGAHLAHRLREVAQPSFVVGPSVSALDAFRPGAVYTGRIAAVKGRLGDFHATVQDTEAPQMPRRELNADQVVIISRDETPAFKQRTGLHVLKNPTEADLDRLAERIRDLIGEFLKPVHVSYNADTCAGGVADQEACGLCAAACPYEAISREPENHLRMKIDHMACEGCGACVSACPTTSMRFTEPSPDELYTRLAALLAPLSSGVDNERSVILFHCGEQGRRVLEEASRRPLPYPASVLPVEVPCLRYLSEATLLASFRLGAAGLAFLGCESCQHGERALFYQKLDFCRLVLDAFALGSERLRLITADDGTASDAINTLSDFAETLKAAPLRWDGKPMTHWDNRAVIADAIAAFIAETGQEPGPSPLDATHPFAFAEVRASGCTMCRSCVNVCPTHAFRLDDNAWSLQFKHIACVACGLCERVCPEKVITLKPEIHFDREALDYRTVVKDDTVPCVQCGKPYINRKALEIVEARLLSLESLLDTFAGSRRTLLRMCPDCRAAVAMLEVEKGWKP